MGRLKLRDLGRVLLLGVGTTACLGGQTGQPDSATCERRAASAAAEWRGTTVGEAMTTFVGSHEAKLSWRDEPRDSTAQTPVVVQDTLEIGITYDGTSGTVSCLGNVTLPVTVSLRSARGIDEGGPASLELSGSPGALVATLDYAGPHVVLDATLEQLTSGIATSGSLDARDTSLPGASAVWGEEP